MSDLIQLVSKKEKEKPSDAEFQKQLDDEYYEQMNEIRDEIDLALTLAYTKEGLLLTVSNGVDAKTALWMIEEFRMNLLTGSFNDYK
jgi:hypothetical protein